MRFAPLPLLTVFAIPALVVLIWLGQWQWARMDEKTRLFEEIARARTLEPAAIEAALANPQEYDRVRALALAPATIATWGPQGRVFQPAPLPGGGAVLVETAKGGTGPAALSPPFDGALRRIEDVGPPNDIEGGVWFRPAPEMGSKLGVSVDPHWYVALDRIEDRTQGQGFLIDNPRSDPRLVAVGPERHLGYALTWWGLAAGLVAVYFAMHARVGKLRFRP